MKPSETGLFLRTSSAVCSFEIFEEVSPIRGLPREEAILWVCESIMEATRFAEEGESVKRTLRKERKNFCPESEKTEKCAF